MLASYLVRPARRDTARRVTRGRESRIAEPGQPTGNAMLRILLSYSSALAACTPLPQDAAMRNTSPISGTAVQGSSEAKREGEGAVTLGSAEQEAGDRVPAAQGPIPEPVSAAENPAAPMPADSPAEALGRQTLSTAFVMVHPDGYLTVELRDGRQMVLRNVIMRRKDYCGGRVLNGLPGKQYCGRYADIVAVRPGGAPALEDSNTTISNSITSASIPVINLNVLPNRPKTEELRLGEC